MAQAALAEPTMRGGLGSRIRQRFADLEDVAMELPPRTERPRHADFAE